MRFSDLSQAEQRFEVTDALARVLAALNRVTPTSVVSARVARELVAWEAREDEVSGQVLKVAMAGHPQARQDGETFKRWGRPMRRWQWYPPADVARPPSPEENKAQALAEADRPPSLKMLQAARDLGMTIEEYKAMVADIKPATPDWDT